MATEYHLNGAHATSKDCTALVLCRSRNNRKRLHTTLHSSIEELLVLQGIIALNALGVSNHKDISPLFTKWTLGHSTVSLRPPLSYFGLHVSKCRTER